MIYENISQKITADTSVVSENSFSAIDQAMLVFESSNVAFNEMFRNIGIDELAVYESTGSVVVYEGAKLDEFKNSVKKWFEEFLAKVKGVYDSLMTAYDKKIAEIKKNFTSKITQDMVKNLDDQKVYGKVHKFDINAKQYSDAGKALINEIVGKVTQFVHAADGELNVQDGLALFDEYDGKTLINKISGVEADTVRDMTKPLREKIMGEEVEATKSWISANLSEIQNTVFDSNKFKRDVKSSYQTQKDLVNTSMGQIKKMDDRYSALFKKVSSVMKDVNNVVYMCNSTALSCYSKMVHENVSVLLAVYKVGSKKKEATNESAYLDIVNSVLGM